MVTGEAAGLEEEDREDIKLPVMIYILETCNNWSSGECRGMVKHSLLIGPTLVYATNIPSGITLRKSSSP